MLSSMYILNVQSVLHVYITCVFYMHIYWCTHFMLTMFIFWITQALLEHLKANNSNCPTMDMSQEIIALLIDIMAVSYTSSFA